MPQFAVWYEELNSQILEDVLEHCCTTSLCYLGAETDDRVIENLVIWLGDY